MSCCTNTFNVCAVQGTNFALDIGLTPSYAEVVENPQNYEVVMTFLDGELEVLQLTADLEPYDDLVLDLPLAAHITATPAQTATLPEGRSNHTVDLVSKTLPAWVQRLFEGNVEVRA